MTKDKHPAREMMNVGFEKIGSKRTKVVRKNWSILREKSEKLITFFGFVNCAARARVRGTRKTRRKAGKTLRGNGASKTHINEQ